MFMFLLFLINIILLMDRAVTSKQTVICQYVNIPILSLNVTYLIASLSFFMATTTMYARMGANKLLFIGAMLHITRHGFHFDSCLAPLLLGVFLLEAELV